jgi:ribonuclease HI
MVTNNECEWAAMCKAVERATEQGERHLDLYTDSDIVVNQLMNNYTINEPIHSTYHARTVAALAKASAWRIQHVHREVNKAADSLATTGQDPSTADEHIEPIPLPAAMPMRRPAAHIS